MVKWYPGPLYMVDIRKLEVHLIHVLVPKRFGGHGNRAMTA